MNNIKVVRLRNGEDLVAQVEEIGHGRLVFSEPMYFELMQKGENMHIAMSHYLPVQLIKKNEMVISESEVLCMISPTESFAEYYSNSVIKIKELMQMREDLEDGSVEEGTLTKVLMEAFNELETSEMTKH
jgi:predicted RNA-binding protein (virulence factor B family)